MVSNLKIERVKRNKTQTEIADILEVSQTYYRAIETLKTSPSDLRKEQLEKYFKRDIDYLLDELKEVD